MLLALDLGTTSLAGRLLDERGEVLSEGQSLNPQVAFGADVLRRLEAARSGRGEALQATVVSGINGLVTELLDRAGREPEAIVAAAAAGNPAVSMTLRNLSPEPLLSPPYRPDDCSSARLEPGESGLELPVPLFLFPLVNGFVGGDLVAFLFGQDEPKETALYVDIGTNGEMALFADGRWWVTSVAAGPAFEGGEVSSGMLYGPGAIAGCRLDGDRLKFAVVGHSPPRGICGSGLAEIIAAALEGGLIGPDGGIADPDSVGTNLSRYIVRQGDERSLLLYRDADRSILLEQPDIRNFQLAKAAVRAGIDCLLQKAGVTPRQVRDVVVTGAFGFSLSREALKRVAMLPEIMVDKVRFEPGGALRGVGKMLLLKDGPERVAHLAGNLKPYPLSGTPTFERAFIKSIDFLMP